MFHVSKNKIYRVSNGLIFFKNNNQTINFVKKWIDKSNEYGITCKNPNQDTFYDTYKEINSLKYGLFSLLKYNWLCVTPNGTNLLSNKVFNHVIIVQYQASRLDKKKDNKIKYTNLKKLILYLNN